MSKMLNTAQAAIAWVNRTRQHAMTLDNEADALLAQLNGAAATESALNTARNERASIGLYGYAQAAKAHLLAALCSSGNGKVNVITPDTPPPTWCFALRDRKTGPTTSGRCACDW